MLWDFKNALASSTRIIKEAFLLSEDQALESLPEPYLPLYDTLTEMPKTLRERALGTSGTRNPSQLGDPISLKAEQSDNIPTPDENGADSTSSYSANSRSYSGSNSRSAGKKTIRERAMQLRHGPNANPSQLGDPISMTAERTGYAPTRRDSKL
jgi:hypothetical protein